MMPLAGQERRALICPAFPAGMPHATNREGSQG